MEVYQLGHAVTFQSEGYAVYPVQIYAPIIKISTYVRIKHFNDMNILQLFLNSFIHV